MAGNADEVAQIEHLKQLERPGAYDVKFYVYLQTLAGSGNVREAGLAVQAKCEDTPSHAHGRLGGFERCRIDRCIFFNKFGCGCRPIEPVGVRLMAAGFNFGKLLLALEILILRLKR
jgi:hypothetical protein